MNYDELSEVEKHYFTLYKSNEDSFAYLLNDYLRSKDDFIKYYGGAIKFLDSIISKSVLPEDIVLHRATVDTCIAPYISGTRYNNPEYLSSGADLKSVQIHFTDPNNPAYVKYICAKGMNAAHFETNSSFDDLEKEMLLGRNNEFEVIDNRITEEKKEIEAIMTKFKSIGVRALKIYTFKWVRKM
jgi:hypothetical protein